MTKMKNVELKVLESICNDFDLPLKLVSQLLRSAEGYSYENASPAVRRKDYLDLITFYAKNENKGE